MASQIQSLSKKSFAFCAALLLLSENSALALPGADRRPIREQPQKPHLPAPATPAAPVTYGELPCSEVPANPRLPAGYTARASQRFCVVIRNGKKRVPNHVQLKVTFRDRTTQETETFAYGALCAMFGECTPKHTRVTRRQPPYFTRIADDEICFESYPLQKSHGPIGSWAHLTGYEITGLSAQYTDLDPRKWHGKAAGVVYGSFCEIKKDDKDREVVNTIETKAWIDFTVPKPDEAGTEIVSAPGYEIPAKSQLIKSASDPAAAGLPGQAVAEEEQKAASSSEIPDSSSEDDTSDGAKAGSGRE